MPAVVVHEFAEFLGIREGTESGPGEAQEWGAVGVGEGFGEAADAAGSEAGEVAVFFSSDGADVMGEGGDAGAAHVGVAGVLAASVFIPNVADVVGAFCDEVVGGAEVGGGDVEAAAHHEGEGELGLHGDAVDGAVAISAGFVLGPVSPAAVDELGLKEPTLYLLEFGEDPFLAGEEVVFGESGAVQGVFPAVEAAVVDLIISGSGHFFDGFFDGGEVIFLAGSEEGEGGEGVGIGAAAPESVGALFAEEVGVGFFEDAVGFGTVVGEGLGKGAVFFGELQGGREGLAAADELEGDCSAVGVEGFAELQYGAFVAEELGAVSELVGFGKRAAVDAGYAVAGKDFCVSRSVGEDKGDFEFFRLFKGDLGASSGDAEIDEPATGLGIGLGLCLLVPGGVFAKGLTGERGGEEKSGEEEREIFHGNRSIREESVICCKCFSRTDEGGGRVVIRDLQS